VDDLALFLQKYENVLNQVTRIVRSFSDLDFFKVIYCEVALTGPHRVKLFLFLTTSADTTSTKTTPTFQQVYQELTDTNETTLLKDNLQIYATE